MRIKQTYDNTNFYIIHCKLDESKCLCGREMKNTDADAIQSEFIPVSNHFPISCSACLKVIEVCKKILKV